MLSTPEFFVAYIMMALFAVKFEIFPSLALVDDDAPLGEKLHASVLPGNDPGIRDHPTGNAYYSRRPDQFTEL